MLCRNGLRTLPGLGSGVRTSSPLQFTLGKLECYEMAAARRHFAALVSNAAEVNTSLLPWAETMRQ
jgi:hypothetical protein